MDMDMKEDFIYFRACISSVLVSYGSLCFVCCIVDLIGWVGGYWRFAQGWICEKKWKIIYVYKWDMVFSLEHGKGKGMGGFGCLGVMDFTSFCV